eukprot:m.5499 g.5499  ORF g.5499 m.5499 type:complete len:264 (+) comp3317_c0_seq1:199-990(+)
MSEPSMAALQIGDRVHVVDARTPDRTGIVRYFGPAQKLKGEWVGVDLDPPHVGRHNGTVDGVKYFECLPYRGIMVRRRKVRPLQEYCDLNKAMDVDKNKPKEHNIDQAASLTVQAAEREAFNAAKKKLEKEKEEFERKRQLYPKNGHSDKASVTNGKDDSDASSKLLSLVNEVQQVLNKDQAENKLDSVLATLIMTLSERVSKCESKLETKKASPEVEAGEKEKDASTKKEDGDRDAEPEITENVDKKQKQKNRISVNEDDFY